MKKVILCIIFAIGFSLSVRADFVPGTEDLPAMDDMIFSEDIVSFDAPEGQILSVLGKTRATSAQIKQFYQTNLIPLGWQHKGSNRFERGHDVLELEIIPSGKYQLVRFSLTLSND